jgi:hypothetical protein
VRYSQPKAILVAIVYCISIKRLVPVYNSAGEDYSYPVYSSYYGYNSIPLTNLGCRTLKKGRLALVFFLNAISLTDEPSHARLPAKVTDYYVYDKADNVLDFTYATPEGSFRTEITTVQDVYEAIIASNGIVFPTEALARHDV